jgi:uncharacterized protein
MLLDLTTLTSDRTPLVREIAADPLAVSADDFVVDGTLHLAAELARKGGGEYLVDGTLDGILQVPCSRCLEPFALPLSTRLDVRLLPVAQLAGSEEHEIRDDDLTTEFYENDVLDVAALVREQCYLAMPMKPLCRPDCQGMCPQCGANLNVTTCACDRTWVDPRLAALKALVPERPPE